MATGFWCKKSLRRWLPVLFVAFPLPGGLEAEGSTLTLKRLDGSAIPYCSEAEPSFVAEIQTSFVNLTTVSLQLITVKAGDREIAVINNPRLTPNQQLSFRDTFSFHWDSSQKQDGKLQSAMYDSIWVTWANPFDAKEILGGSVRVRPAPKQAEIYFTDKDGKPINGQWPDSTYLLLKDQAFDPDKKYTIIVIRKPADSNLYTPDTTTLSFTSGSSTTSGGLATILTLLLGSSGSSGSGSVISNLVQGDFLEAFYQDPADGDTARVGTMYTGPNKPSNTIHKKDSRSGNRNAQRHDVGACNLQGKKVILSAVAANSKSRLIFTTRHLPCSRQVVVVPGQHPYP